MDDDDVVVDVIVDVSVGSRDLVARPVRGIERGEWVRWWRVDKAQ